MAPYATRHGLDVGRKIWLAAWRARRGAAIARRAGPLVTRLLRRKLAAGRTPVRRMRVR